MTTNHKLWWTIAVICTALIIVAIGVWIMTTSMGQFGYFEGRVVAVWSNDGRQMTLNEPFVYVAPDGKKWNAPNGSVVDGASIPRLFWTLIGGPFEGKYRNASVVHDVACQEKMESWEEVHLMFYFACRCGGVGTAKAKLMYWAVYHGCPRWKRCLVDGKPVYEMRSPPIKHFDEEQVQRITSYIETNNPSLEELRSLRLD